MLRTIASFVLHILLSYYLLQILLLSSPTSYQVSLVNTRLSKQSLPTKMKMLLEGEKLQYLQYVICIYI